ncbi:uncharacterized protein LOC120077287 [Benincasa hispida]|uniref:uncharacterized protein LOC120077287 n=1 Tax=Benincasa hispida TaxID=102211 RepID=UPI0018FFA16F|nr:uncharacterized protein LOC120077287 [Benincasa hispida]
MLIGGINVGYVLYDLGASINLMTLLIFKKLGIGEARPTTMMLQLTDRSITYLEGKIEDVLMKVDKLIFSIDFIILDYEADRDISIILGRLFLVVIKVLIDVYKGEITVCVDNQEIKFNVLNALKFPDDAESFQLIDSIQLSEEEDQVYEVHALNESTRKLELLSLDEQ